MVQADEDCEIQSEYSYNPQGFVHQIPVLEVWWMLQGKCLDPLEDWWDVLEGTNQQRDPEDVMTKVSSCTARCSEPQVDSGANVAGVRKSLVMPDQFLDKTQAVRTFGGRVENYPVAVVQVDTPLFAGPLECCVLKDPVADLIVEVLESSQATALLPVEDSDPLPLPTVPSGKSETVDDVVIDANLTCTQKKELRDVFSSCSSIMTTDPGSFSGNLEHEIRLRQSEPVFKKQYPLPFASREVLQKEVRSMIQLGVIEPSFSPYCAPVVLVKKKDGSTRVCIDFRALNKVTIFDAEPIPDIDDLFARLSSAVYFTKIDLAKGYWQIRVKEEDKPKTAFQTPQGLYQWTRMPFGLVSAPAAFARMMRMLDLERFSAMNFFDDVLVSSVDWSSHLNDVKGVLSTLESFGLTIRPSKVHAGFQEVEFLGHIVGKGCLKPEQGKVAKILQVSTPTTKKQIRSLLGLVGYYRRYIPNFAGLTAPISDLLKGKRGKSLLWTSGCAQALSQIQAFLSSSPVLHLPDLTRAFLVQTDASSVGIGGVLMQGHNGTLHPVSFVSRKLLDRETRYSTIERECLAIVWTLSKLSRVEGFVHQIPVLEVWWMLQGKCLDPLEDWWDVLEGTNQQRDPEDVMTKVSSCTARCSEPQV
ncbi:hypothetical protein ACOMHN_010933 [Nucella lapillus]